MESVPERVRGQVTALRAALYDGIEAGQICGRFFRKSFILWTCERVSITVYKIEVERILPPYPLSAMRAAVSVMFERARALFAASRAMLCGGVVGCAVSASLPRFLLFCGSKSVLNHTVSAEPSLEILTVPGPVTPLRALFAMTAPRTLLFSR
jgi:hypothetical protein